MSDKKWWERDHPLAKAFLNLSHMNEKYEASEHQTNVSCEITNLAELVFTFQDASSRLANMQTEQVLHFQKCFYATWHALQEIANHSQSDVVKYIQEVDKIALDALDKVKELEQQHEQEE